MEILKNFFNIIKKILDFIQNYFKSLVFLIILLLIFGTSEKQVQEANLVQIDVHGAIMSADDVLKKIEIAKKSNIKGVLIDIDSPGGAVSPSIEIAMSIKELKKLKPVIVYASGTMASGGYYSAIWADKIIANPGSLVGSIGVILQSANVEKLLEKIGVESQNVKSGKYKEIGTPARLWTNDEKAELQRITDDTYDMFVTDVASARGLDVKDKAKFADAHVFTAREAKAVGLVDTVDVKYRAINELKAVSGVSEAVWYEDDKMDKFFESLASHASSQIVSLFMTKMY